MIDGDTISVYIEGKRYRTRLLVIDTPESIKKNNMWGSKATNFTQYLIDKSSKVFIQLDNKVETMDRWRNEELETL